MSEKDWFVEIFEAINQKKIISMIWFVEEFNIIIKPYNDLVDFRIEHGTQGFGENEIMSKEHTFSHLKNYNKPDLINIE